MSEILTEAFEDYVTPSSKKRLEKKIKKAAKQIPPTVFKAKKETAKFPGKK